MHNGSLAFIQLNRIESQNSNHSKHDSHDWLFLKPIYLASSEPNPNQLKGRVSQPHVAAAQKCLGMEATRIILFFLLFPSRAFCFWCFLSGRDASSQPGWDLCAGFLSSFGSSSCRNATLTVRAIRRMNRNEGGVGVLKNPQIDLDI